jgi:hypothetical protein
LQHGAGGSIDQLRVRGGQPEPLASVLSLPNMAVNEGVPPPEGPRSRARFT